MEITNELFSFNKHMSLTLWNSNRNYIFSPNHLSPVLLTQVVLRRALGVSVFTHIFVWPC